jgi:hypothetical protein
MSTSIGSDQVGIGLLGVKALIGWDMHAFSFVTQLKVGLLRRIESIIQVCSVFRKDDVGVWCLCVSAGMADDLF